MPYTTIDKPTDYFNTKLYTGNGSTNAITGVGHQPDLVWLKERSSAGAGLLFDAVRGATKFVRSSDTAAEVTAADTLTAFNSDGFTLGADASNYAANQNSQTYASWNWKAGTSFTNDASSTGIGTIDSSGSVNTDAGFSICSWVGTGSNGTIKHGLSTVPEIMIIKNTGHDTNWSVYTKPTGELGELRLNNTDAFTDDATLYNDTAPTSSVFSVGTNYNTNHSDGRTYIGYIFSSVKGYSKFGSYKGNGNADGTFVYTGFKPAFVMFKKSNASGTSWGIFDNKRDVDNVVQKFLQPNDSGAEESGDRVDFLSNGFKLRTNWTVLNNSGDTFIYMAFAESPFIASNFVPTTAR